MKDTMLEIAKRVDAFFAGKSPIHETMYRLAGSLREMNISFAIAGYIRSARWRARGMQAAKAPTGCAPSAGPAGNPSIGVLSWA